MKANILNLKQLHSQTMGHMPEPAALQINVNYAHHTASKDPAVAQPRQLSGA